MKEYDPEFIVSAIILLQRRFSQKDIAYAFDIPISDVESVSAGFYNGWEEAATALQQAVISGQNLTTEAILNIFRKAKHLGEIPDNTIVDAANNKDYYVCANEIGYQMSLSINGESLGETIPTEEMQNILNQFPYDTARTTEQLSETLKYAGESDDPILENVDSLYLVFGKDVVDRLKERIPYVRLRDLMMALPEEQARFFLDAVDNFIKSGEDDFAVLETIISDGIDQGLIDSRFEEAFYKYYKKE